MTKAMTILALTCFLIVGAAATSILGRDSVPSAQHFAVASATISPDIASADLVSAGMSEPVSNKEGKTDRLVPATIALASLEPPLQINAAPTDPVLTETLRQTIPASPSADIPRAETKASAPALIPEIRVPPPPKLAAKPAPQKSYALLSDIQIAGIKDRLKLSSDQEYYWPAVENALRGIARKIQLTRQANPNATGAPIDPDSTEVQQLKSAAMPLLFQLREDQKREVRSLARIIGLERVAAQI